MEYVCSDTNIWIDFVRIDMLELPFKLGCKFIMYRESISSEILYPPDMGDRLKNLGLIPTEIDGYEFMLAMEIVNSHRRLSKHDAVAFAIAKNRGITLLTGDSRLRKVARLHGVHVMGTLGIIDKLKDMNLAENTELLRCLRLLSHENGGYIRLPQNEIDIRIQKLENSN